MLMMLWGRFPFGIATAAFQELNRTTNWRWPAQELFGQMPTRQYVGPGDETITLPGVIYPEFRGGTGQIQKMRDIADQGVPQVLVDGRGNILGKWVATSINEQQSVFSGFGIPLKQEFTITLERVPDPASGNIILKALSAKLGVDLSAIKALVDQVKSAIGILQGGLATARAVVSTAQAVIGAPAALIIETVKKAEHTAEAIKDLAVQASDIIGVRPTIASARAATQILVGGLPGLGAQATAASVAIKAAVQTVVDAHTAVEGVIASNAALVASNRLTRFASTSYHTTKSAAARMPQS